MRKHYRYLVLLFIVLIIISIPVVIYFISSSKWTSEEEIINPVSNKINQEEKDERLSKLDEITDRHFNRDPNFAVIIKNFDTGESYSFNEKKVFDSASLYKLWVMAELMNQVKNGDINLQDSVSGDKNKLDEILSIVTPTPTVEGEEVVLEEKEPEPISMEIDFAMNKMITESDNYAALMLSQKVGYSEVEYFLEENGLESSSFGSPPKTTAGDIALYFEKLYKGEIVDSAYSKEMIEVLKKQTLNDRIPKYLPEDIEVAHKTGELLGNKHDAGIVFTKKGDYLIIVLTKTENETIAAEKIAKFSRDIYRYFDALN